MTGASLHLFSNLPSQVSDARESLVESGQFLASLTLALCFLLRGNRSCIDDRHYTLCQNMCAFHWTSLCGARN